MSGVAGRSGRKKFVPTPVHRDLVKFLVTRGIPQEHIRQLIRNKSAHPLAHSFIGRGWSRDSL